MQGQVNMAYVIKITLLMDPWSSVINWECVQTITHEFSNCRTIRLSYVPFNMQAWNEQSLITTILFIHHNPNFQQYKPQFYKWAPLLICKWNFTAIN